MSWPEVIELAARGHVIGAHGMTHRRLTALGGAELEREIADAGAILSERLGAPSAWFAFPFGDVASVSRPALKAIGRHYRFCRSGVRGLNTHRTERCAVLADAVDLAAPQAYRRVILEGGLDRFYWRARRRLDSLVKA